MAYDSQPKHPRGPERHRNANVFSLRHKYIDRMHTAPSVHAPRNLRIPFLPPGATTLQLTHSLQFVKEKKVCIYLAMWSSSASASVPSLGSVPFNPTPSSGHPQPNHPLRDTQSSSTRFQHGSWISTSGEPTTMQSACSGEWMGGWVGGGVNRRAEMK